MPIDIQKALDSTTGAALIPESLAPVVVEYAKKLNPLMGILRWNKAAGKTHEFARRTALPASGPEGEGAVTPSSRSSYARDSVQLKIIRTRGGVTGFERAATASFADALQTELNGAVESQAYSIEQQLLWGNSADPYQIDGLDALITTNLIDVDGVIQLADLDEMIDLVRDSGAKRDPLLLIMSNKMLSKVSSLYVSQFSLQLPSVDVRGGYRLSAYRDIPILESSFLRPAATMGAVDLQADSGGNLAAGTYYVRVSAVTQDGETVACASQSVTVSDNGKIVVDWTGSAVEGALLYKIYTTEPDGEAGGETLQLVVAGRTYDGDGTPSGAVTGAEVTKYVSGGNPPLDEGDETVYLVDLNPDQGLEVEYLGLSPIVIERLARTSDSEEFLLKTYFALAAKGEKHCARLLRVRTE